MSDFTAIPYDIDVLDSELKREILATSQWKDIYQNDTILNLFIYILKYFMTLEFGTINNEFINSFPNLTSSSEVLYKFANLIGMSISGATSAIGSQAIKLYLDTAHTEDIDFTTTKNYRTEIRNSTTGYIYTITNSTTLTTENTEVIVDVIQGYYPHEDAPVIAYSDGSINQYYYFQYTIDKYNSNIYVDDILWTRVDNFINSTSTDLHYTVTYTINGTYFQFGDGVKGQIPTSGKEIRFDYLITNGISGNLYSLNGTFTINTDVFDSATTPVNVTDLLSVLQIGSITGGTDNSTLDEIKQSITTYLKTNPYIWTKDDYESYLRICTTPSVLDAKVFAGWELYPDYTDRYATLYAYVAKTDLGELSTTDKTDLYDYLVTNTNNASFFSVNIQFLDANIMKVQTTVNIKFTTGTTTSIANARKSLITNTIINPYFNNQLIVNNGGLIYRNIYNSDLIKLIADVSNVSHCSIDFKVYDYVGTVNGGLTPVYSYSKVLLYKFASEDKINIEIKNISGVIIEIPVTLVGTSFTTIYTYGISETIYISIAEYDENSYEINLQFSNPTDYNGKDINVTTVILSDVGVITENENIIFKQSDSAPVVYVEL